MRSAAIVVILSLFAMGPVTALAQQGPMGGPGPGGNEGMQKQFAPEQFPEVKARMLKMLDERKARIEQEKACVEKAANHEELRKCRSEPPMGGPMHRGPGPQRPPQTGGEAAK